MPKKIKTLIGGLGSDWPDGFLDVGAGEMESLLGAGLAKRKKN